jgi:hypothetical protein
MISALMGCEVDSLKLQAYWLLRYLDRGYLKMLLYQTSIIQDVIKLKMNAAG